MWKSTATGILQYSKQIVLPNRNVFILKRRRPCMLHKYGRPPKAFRSRNFIYDVVDSTDKALAEKQLELILLDTVPGLGIAGEIVKVRSDPAYARLLLPGLAAYSTPENIDKYSNKKPTTQYSSKNVGILMRALSLKIFPILMNQEKEWTLEPWHVRLALRLAGVVAPEEAIKLPEKLISHPDLDVENKLFPVEVIINDTEVTTILCKIELLYGDDSDTLSSDASINQNQPLFEDDKLLVNSLLAKLESEKLTKEIYTDWF